MSAEFHDLGDLCPICGGIVTPDDAGWKCEYCYADGFYEEYDPFDGTLFDPREEEDVDDEM